MDVFLDLFQAGHPCVPHIAIMSRSEAKCAGIITRVTAWPLVCLLLMVLLSCQQKIQTTTHKSDGEQVTLREVPSQNKIDVLIDGALFTSYRWPENVYKPVLYPIISSAGSTITRGFPLETRAGERNDHRHQVGNWLNYGNVNGFDFWGNGHTGERLPNGGEIRHAAIERRSSGLGEASLTARARWLDASGNELMEERTELHFISRGRVRIIDRITVLTATGGDSIVFKDTKEGMFGLRVARALELPSQEQISLTDAAGKLLPKQVNNEGVTGNYRSSEGVTGEAVWGTRARWMDLRGNIKGENVSVTICDHPKNISYPTWWHARGYGLFSANPLGAKDFTKGKEELNFTLAARDSLTFRYRIVIAAVDPLSDEDLNRISDEFAGKY